MMATYARIDGGVVAELFATDGDIAEMFHPDMIWVDCSTVSGIAVGWTFEGQVFAPAPGPSPADIQAALAAQAKAALDTSDTTIVRCYEHAVAVPAEWQAYRADLRAVVSGSSSATSLPTRPTFPAGT